MYTVLVGCTGQISHGEPSRPVEPTTPGVSGAPNDPTDTPRGATAVPPAGSACDPRQTVVPGRYPLRRLSGAEWINTVRDLLGDVPNLTVQFPPDEIGLGGFTNSGDALRVDGLLLERIRDASEILAQTAVAKLGDLLGCSQGEAELACVRRFVQTFGRRAFRRPLADAEVTRLVGLFTTERTASGTLADGVSLVIEAFLNSPHFLLLIAEGSASGRVGTAVPLTGHELASRLSYFIWRSMPDQELLQAAASGALAQPAELEKQARRLLAHPKAQAAVAAFHREWLDLGRIHHTTKVGAEWTAALKVALLAETETFLADTFWKDGRFETLLVAPHSFLNAETAKHYGLPTGTITGTTPTKVMLPSDGRRMGLLTHGLLLAAHAYADQSSPIHRGKFVREQILCQIPPPPPPSVVAEPPVVDSKASTRERFAQHTKDPGCAACHALMDPIGLGFEHFGPTGRWRDRDGTFAIDPTGNVAATSDADGPFRGAIELAQRLAGSRHVKGCMTMQWFRYGMSRSDDVDADRCTLERLHDRFRARAYDMRELVVAIATADTFRYMRAGS